MTGLMASAGRAPPRLDVLADRSQAAPGAPPKVKSDRTTNPRAAIAGQGDGRQPLACFSGAVRR